MCKKDYLMRNRIAILMATYNGEKFIQQQLESILNQTYKKFDLIIRDDGSTDDTLTIIEKVKNKNPDFSITILKNQKNEHGQVRNFAYLFAYAYSKDVYDYILFSDQDDIWLKDKVLNSLNEIKKHRNVPALVYTNYQVWNMKSNVKNIAYGYRKKEEFSKLFVQNWTMGCTYILNKKMMDLVKGIPTKVENHDYWLALVASISNGLYYYPKVTMVHRIHDNNVTTSSNSNSTYIRAKNMYINNFTVVGRVRKYKSWSCTVDNLIKIFGNNKCLKEVKAILLSNSIKSVILAHRYHFGGINKRTTFLFYLYLISKNNFFRKI